MIDLTINKAGLQHNIEKAKENHVIIPTIAQMQNPDLIPEKVKAKLTGVGLWDVNPLNLFHQLAQRGQGVRRPVPARAELCRDPLEPVGRTLPHRRHGGQVVPHRLPQGRRVLRLPCAASGHRPV